MAVTCNARDSPKISLNALAELLHAVTIKNTPATPNDMPHTVSLSLSLPSPSLSVSFHPFHAHTIATIPLYIFRSRPFSSFHSSKYTSFWHTKPTKQTFKIAVVGVIFSSTIQTSRSFAPVNWHDYDEICIFGFGSIFIILHRFSTADTLVLCDSCELRPRCNQSNDNRTLSIIEQSRAKLFGTILYIS